jgi:hypothetical protein
MFMDDIVTLCEVPENVTDPDCTLETEKPKASFPNGKTIIIVAASPIKETFIAVRENLKVMKASQVHLARTKGIDNSQR